MAWGQEASGSKEGWVDIPLQTIRVAIKAATRLEMQLSRDALGHPSLAGRLLDDRGRGVAAPLSLQLPDQREIALKTDEKGAFSSKVLGFPDKGLFTLRFKGQGAYLPSTLQRHLDLGRVDLTLRATFPPPLDGGVSSFTILAKLHYQGRPLPALPIQLYLGLPQLTTSPEMTPQDKTTPTTPPAPREKTQDCRAMGSPIKTLSTDEQGQVRFQWKGKALEGPASLPLCLLFSGNAYFLPQERRHTLSIGASKQPPKESSPWGYGLIGFLLLVGGGMGWLFWRRLRRRIPDLPPLPLKEGELARQYDQAEIKNHLGRRPPTDRVIAGHVMDIFEKRPIGGIALALQKEDGEEKIVAHTRSDGSFRWEAPSEAEGTLTLWFRSDAYRPFLLRIPCPHYGQGRQCKVSLYSYRYLCLEAYRKGLDAIKNPFDPKKRTAREILALLPNALAALLRPLALGFERSYYAKETPTEGDYNVMLDALKTLNAADLSGISIPRHQDNKALQDAEAALDRASHSLLVPERPTAKTPSAAPPSAPAPQQAPPLIPLSPSPTAPQEALPTAPDETPLEQSLSTDSNLAPHKKSAHSTDSYKALPPHLHQAVPTAHQEVIPLSLPLFHEEESSLPLFHEEESSLPTADVELSSILPQKDAPPPKIHHEAISTAHPKAILAAPPAPTPSLLTLSVEADALPQSPDEMAAKASPPPPQEDPFLPHHTLELTVDEASLARKKALAFAELQRLDRVRHTLHGELHIDDLKNADNPRR